MKKTPRFYNLFLNYGSALISRSLICLLLFYQTLSSYEFSICAIFQDEAPYLKEWIEFHRMIGFEHFWLYNNSSSDDYLPILMPYIQEGIVELIHWPSPKFSLLPPIQKAVYNDCIRRSKERTTWLAVIDIDEFVVPTHGVESFKSTLRQLGMRPNVGGIMLFWQMFGTSHLEKIPENQLSIEALIRKAPFDYGPNHIVKTICRPKAVKEFLVHGAKYHYPYLDIYLNGESGPGTEQSVQTSPLRIHHYWTRDLDFFNHVKLPRREVYEGRPYSQAELDLFDYDLNLEEDTTIWQYVPELKRRLATKN
jgi:hypothetical protein